MGTVGGAKLVVIDGNSLVYRAFYALPMLQNSRGEHTNAVYGFAGMLLKLLEDENPAYLVVAMDYPAPSFRQEIYPSYKGTREKTPEELVEQKQRVREILDSLSIPVLEVEGYEADDIIATLSQRAVEEELDTIVVTGDADLLQLVGDKTTVLFTKKGISRMERFNEKNLIAAYGLKPGQMIDYKALKGDPSDNIPGVPGVGGKTALRLLQEYGNIDEIYKNLDRLKGKLKENLSNYKDQLSTGRKLVALEDGVPLDFSWEESRFTPDYTRLLTLFQELEFKSMAAKVYKYLPEKNGKAGPDEEEEAGELIADAAALSDFLGDLSRGDSLVLLAERGKAYPYWKASLEALALSAGKGRSCYLLPGTFSGGAKSIWKVLCRKFEQGIAVICHDAKFIINHLAWRGFPEPSALFDASLAAYLLDPARSSYDLPYLFAEYLQVQIDGDPEAREKRHLTPEEKGRLLSARANYFFDLKDKLQALLQDEYLDKLYSDLEFPLARTLARMERHGIAVDISSLRDLSSEICSRLGNIEREIYALAGEDFNLNSPLQLSRILFDKLQLPIIRKTKTGLSTDARVLEELAPHHEIVAKILHYRQLIKLEGTYLSGLFPYVDSEEDKIFTTLNQTVTATGRLSSSEPNLQNIPTRLEEGKRIRRSFIPSRRDMVFLAADYSQIELRILAHLSGDSILLEAFQNDEDIHRRTAAEVFKIDTWEVTESMRKKAKAVNFGIIYGISDYGLARGLGVPRQEARQYIENYLERYHGVKEYLDGVISRAREQGFVTTIMKRKRTLPELSAKNFSTRSFGERMARNTPIQGSAADIIKIAMLRIDELVRQGGLQANMLLQIHDELLFEVNEEALAFFAPVVKKEMEQAYRLSVPLKVDLKIGGNWGQLKDYQV